MGSYIKLKQLTVQSICLFSLLDASPAEPGGVPGAVHGGEILGQPARGQDP